MHLRATRVAPGAIASARSLFFIAHPSDHCPSYAQQALRRNPA